MDGLKIDFLWDALIKKKGMKKMSVFRVEKTHDYTVMSNHHLKNKQLSLKAKGLMSLVLSLPDNWDYTLQGLAYISMEKIDAIRRAVNELENEGYIIRNRKRDEHGRLRGTEYIIHEQPISELPTLDNPTTNNPTLDLPTLENSTQLNNNIKNNKKLITDGVSTNSIPFNCDKSNLHFNASKGIEGIKEYEKLIKVNIDYDIIAKRINKTQLDEIVSIMLETICSSRKTIRVASDDFPVQLVKSKLLQLDSTHIEFVVECLKNNTTQIRNIKQYILTALFNAPNTIDNYYAAQVNHDIIGS